MLKQKQNKIWGASFTFAGALLLLMAMFAFSAPAAVQASPGDKSSALLKYPTIVGTNIDDCSLCHKSTAPVVLNAYGTAYKSNGRDTAAFGLIENMDSDKDGFTNVQEIKTYFTFPGNAASTPERLKNGGLNTYPVGSMIPTDWAKSAAFAATDGKDTTTKQQGTASVKIVGAAATSKTLSQAITLSGAAGDKFAFVFWSKGSAVPATGGACQAQVVFFNGAATTLTKTVPCATGAAFAKKSLAITTTTAYTRIVVKLTYSKPTGTIWFDAVSLAK